MYTQTQSEKIQITRELERLERRAYRRLRKLLQELAGLLLVAGFSLYWGTKLLIKISWWWLESPKLKMQIQPGQFVEVSNENIKHARLIIR